MAAFTSHLVDRALSVPVSIAWPASFGRQPAAHPAAARAPPTPTLRPRVKSRLRMLRRGLTAAAGRARQAAGTHKVCSSSKRRLRRACAQNPNAADIRMHSRVSPLPAQGFAELLSTSAAAAAAGGYAEGTPLLLGRAASAAALLSRGSGATCLPAPCWQLGAARGYAQLGTRMPKSGYKPPAEMQRAMQVGQPEVAGAGVERGCCMFLVVVAGQRSAALRRRSALIRLG